jgi:serine protease Do
LRITSDTNGLTPLEFADSSALRLGEVVLAIGYPFGLSGTVTMGIISAKGRANLGITDYEDFLQTDAAINPGNSGGALVDLRGRLVGIPTAILSRSGGYMGVGFAIPSDMAKPIMTSLLEHGHVTRGFLGVTIQTLDDDLARALGISATDGVLIAEVSPDGPAAKAGLRRGDVVLAVDGKKVDSTGEFRNLIAAAGAKKTAELELLRDGKREKVRAELAATPEEQPREARNADAATARPGPAGLRLAPLDATARQRLDVPPSVGAGAVVAAVDPASPAAEAGVRPGDVLLEIGKQPVKSAQHFADVWEKTQGPIALLVFRDGHSFYVVLKR